MSLSPFAQKIKIVRPRLGFVGLGWIGRKRLEAVASRGSAVIAAVADPVPERMHELAGLARGATRFDRFEEMLQMDLDGMVIATPSAQHKAQVAAALDAGLAVFCQKPLARTSDEVQTLLDKAAAADRLLGIDLSYRHCHGVRLMQDLVRSGEIGKIFAANFTFHNAYGPDKPWFYDLSLSGGGCVIDLGIHLVDLVQWILGDSVVTLHSDLFAKGERLRPPIEVVEDYAAVNLELASGTSTTLTCSWGLHAGCDADIEVTLHGTLGGVRWHNVNGSFTEFRTEQLHGTRSVVRTQGEQAWGDGAIHAWVDQLGCDSRFCPSVLEHAEVARTLDRIYGRDISRHLHGP